ncbi:MAG TPA: 30S ribosomal protein S8 [Candidatus Paceibacterota bacterium]|nr:30S ribosomal protein S8 [Candidatus Paceibacterota bacterium]
MDPIADMLTRIRNAQAARKERVTVPFSKVKFRIANILASAGYLGDVERRKVKAGRSEHDILDLGLKYLPAGQAGGNNGLGAISGLKLVSRPSRRLYTGAKDIRPVRSGFGFSVMSTSKGIMSSKDARKENVGGEIMFEIW